MGKRISSINSITFLHKQFRSLCKLLDHFLDVAVSETWFQMGLKTHPHVHHYRCWPKDARTRAEISLKICCNLTWLNATISFQKQSASQMDFVVANLYPGRLTWNIKITQLKRKIILPKPSLWLCSMLMFRGVSRTDGILVGQFGMRRHFQHNHNDQVLHMQRFLNSTF